MKHYISCDNPVSIKTSKGPSLVGCGHCVQCLQAKNASLTLRLSLESQAHMYNELINLTYNDSFIPYVDTNRPLHDNVFPICFGPRTRKRWNPRSHTFILE